MNTKKPFQIGPIAIICDSPTCDFEQSDVTDFVSWLNVPCPKCGENLLTADDMKRMNDFVTFSDVINELLGDVPEDEPMISVPVTTHKVLRFDL